VIRVINLYKCLGGIFSCSLHHSIHASRVILLVFGDIINHIVDYDPSVVSMIVLSNFLPTKKGKLA